MTLGTFILLVGIWLIVSTLKRPMWLGGQKRRSMHDDTALAAINRANKRTAGLWALLIGAIFLSADI